MPGEEPWEIRILAPFLLVVALLVPPILLVTYAYPDAVWDAAGVTVQWGILAIGLGPLMFVALVGYAYLKMESIKRQLDAQNTIKKVRMDEWAEEMEEDIETSYESYAKTYETESFYAGRYPF